MFAAIYTEVEPATDRHGTQVVARQGHTRVAVPYPYELTAWEDVHGVAVQEFLNKQGAQIASDWIPALLGQGVVWTCTAQPAVHFATKRKGR